MWYGRDTSTSKVEMVVDGMFTLSVGCLHSRVGTYLVLLSSANHVDGRFQPPTQSARNMPLFGQSEQNGVPEVRLILRVWRIKAESLWSILYLGKICRCVALLIRRYAPMEYLTLLRKAYRFITEPYRTLPSCNLLSIIVQPWINCHLPQ